MRLATSPLASAMTSAMLAGNARPAAGLHVVGQSSLGGPPRDDER